MSTGSLLKNKQQQPPNHKTATVNDSNISVNTVSLPSAADGIRRDQRSRPDKNLMFSLVAANMKRNCI